MFHSQGRCHSGPAGLLMGWGPYAKSKEIVNFVMPVVKNILNYSL